MTEAVLDASVFLKWFHPHNEADLPAAHALRDAMRARTLLVFVPPLLYLEILNVAGKRWRLKRDDLVEIAHALETLPLEIRQPALGGIAEWTSLGLTAYDASYVALAQAESLPLLTDDHQILQIAPTIAKSLATISAAGIN